MNIPVSIGFRPFPPQYRPGLPSNLLTGSPVDLPDAVTAWRADDEAMEERAYCWAAYRFPLKVLLPEDARREAPVFLAALKQWESAMPELIRFELVPASHPENGAEADLIFLWSNDTTLGREFETGHTDCVVKGSAHAAHIVQARITLIRRPVIDGRLNASGRAERLMATILHELGHALGLKHSQYPGDLMHYRNWRRTTLAEGDIRVLRQQYSGC